MKYKSITIILVENGYSVSATEYMPPKNIGAAFGFSPVEPSTFVFNTAAALADWIEANVERPAS